MRGSAFVEARRCVIGMSALASSTSPAGALKARQIKFGAEFSFLLACCSLRKEELDFSGLPDDLDWARTLELAEHHGVAPLVHQALCRRPTFAPDSVVEQLRTRYESNARKNLKFVGELFRILDCLEAHGIQAIPLKGPALAEILYGDIALRDFSDLDVLVHVRDVLRAKDALRGLDYSVTTPLSKGEESAYLGAGYEYTFDSPAGRNLFELQWSIVPRFYAVAFDVDGLFSRAEFVQLCGRTVRTLSPEDMVLSLTVHAAKHAWVRLHWLRDIAGVVVTQRLDWDLLTQRTRTLGIARIVGVSLLLAHRLLALDVPEASELFWSRDSEIPKIAQFVEQGLPAAEKYDVESIPYFRLMMRLRERSIDRARFLWRLASTPGPGEWAVVRLPKDLFPLYRAVRVFRLAARVLRRRG